MEERRDLVIVNIYKLLKLTKDGYNREVNLIRKIIKVALNDSGLE